MAPSWREFRQSSSQSVIQSVSQTHTHREDKEREGEGRERKGRRKKERREKAMFVVMWP